MVALLSWGVESSAQARRYALVIGANAGDPSDEPLLFAVRDAERVAQVLGSLGGVQAEDLILLKDPGAVEVERVLGALNARIRADETAGAESLLFLYYSGHADPSAMHLGGSLLHFDRVRAALGSSPAKLRVMVIDACRSGGLTRTKGARPVEAFKIDASGQLDGEGTAIITSSAASEDALESQRLKGSFFTHHFVTGLLGAADTSRDKRVTLTEAYRYAYTETLRATSRVASVQHPTYAFKMNGRDELVMTRLDREARGLGRLRLGSAGDYLIFEGGDRGAVVAELSVVEASELTLPAGSYLVRRVAGGKVFEAEIAVEGGRRSGVSVDQMRRVSGGEVVRKGMSDEVGASWGLSVGGEASAEVLPGTGPILAGVIGAAVDLDSVTLRVELLAGQSRSENASLSLSQDLLGLEVAALKLFDLDALALGFGIEVGGAWLRQRFDSEGTAPSRASLIGRGGAVVHGSWSVQPWMWIYAEGVLGAWLVKEQSVETGEVGFGGRLAPSGSAGLGFRF